MNLDLAKDVLRFARDGISIYDYRQFTLRSRGAGSSALDRQRVLDQLIENGTVVVDSERLRINQLADWSWIHQSALAGDSVIWSIVDEYVPIRIQTVIDDKVRAEIGAAGEQEVLRRLETELDEASFAKVRQVSLVDDAAGYDISAPSVGDKEGLQMLEVKTSTRPSSYFHFFLSRNEFLKGLANSSWYLVFVRSKNQNEQVLGHLSMSFFEDDFPREVSKEIVADGYRIRVSIDSFVPGLP